jgi:nucleotide-binding universal stress UspA family protein
MLVPLDGSRLAEMALPTAIDLLRDNPDATLILLRAAQATTVPGVDPTDAQVAVVGEAEDYLERVAADLRDSGLSRVITSVWYSQPARAIVEAARVRGVDLIVMSTHGRSGLRRVVLGSVAESVVRGTPTPTLLVSAAGARVGARRRRRPGHTARNGQSSVGARGVHPSSSGVDETAPQGVLSHGRK